MRELNFKVGKMKYFKFIFLLSAFVFCQMAAMAQERRVSGKVSDENEQPLAGVVVRALEDNAGTMTDKDGRYSLKIADGVKRLEFSMLGYTKIVKSLGDKTVVNVKMTEQDKRLSEVVVIGYGAVSKKDLTGAVGQVNVEDLAKAPVGSFAEALAGRVSGVQVSSVDGQPGAENSIIIRGANSLTQNNSPLFVVDGIPMEDFDPASLSAEDIKSMSVLKDASAIAIYGSRAANGVIVITTQKGMVGKPIVSFSAKVGFPRMTNWIEMMDAYEYVKYLEEYDESRARLLYFQDGKTLEDYRNAPGINWQKQISASNPMTMIYDLSVRGGTPQTRYSISGSYYGQDGIISNSGNSSFRGRASIDQMIRSKFKVGVDVTGSHNKNYGQLISSEGISSTTITNLLYRVWAYRPYSPNSDLEELLVDDDMYSNNDFRINPVLSNSNEFREQIRDDLRVTAYMEYKPTGYLTINVRGAVNNRKESTENFNNSNTINGSPYNNRNTKGQWGSVSHYQRTIYTNENTITFDRKIRDVHHLNVVGGASFELGVTKSDGMSAINVPYDELGIYGLGMGVANGVSYSYGDYTMASFYGRANYVYDSRYLFTVTMRADGSSKFAPGHKWGYFPSVAASWNVAEEEFLRYVPQISSLKLRTSYGVTGNNRIGNYDYMASLDSGIKNYYSFGNQTPSLGVGTSRLANPKLKWEETKQFDAGIDFSILNNRISFTVDYYNKYTDNLLLNSQIPASTGYTYAMQNIGKVRNSGWEFSFESTNIKTPVFAWKSGFNISFNRNKVLKLNNDQNNRLDFARFQTTYNNTPMYITEVGKPMGLFYGFIFDGIYQTSDFRNLTEGIYVLNPGVADNGSSDVSPGVIKYKDINGDGTINDYDRVILGSPHPKHTGGFTNDFSYSTRRIGTFTLNVLLQWSYGNKVFNANRLIFEGNGTAQVGINQYKSYEERWTPDHPSNTLFKTKGAGPQGFISDRTLEDGSYLRLKTLELGYDLPQRWMKKIKVRSINLNIAAQNLFTWTRYSGLDPEVSILNSVLTSGFDFCAYPRAKTVTFGFRIRL